MEELFRQIKLGLDNNLYLLSLSSALSIPDICAALDSIDGQTKKPQYVSWFNTNVSHKYNGFLTGEDCYYFRCSFLHQGSTQHTKSKYSRIIFLEPNNGKKIVLHNNIVNDALNIDLTIFCNDIIDSARKWIDQNKTTPNFQKNITNLIQRYSDGISPYIIGTPVIG